MILHVRLPGAGRSLRRQAHAVNVVWNYCTAVQRKAVESRRRWLSAYDLMKLTAGAGELLGLHSHTVSGVCKHFDEQRRLARAPWLERRASPTWVPFNTGHVSFDGEHIVFRGEGFVPAHVPADLLPGEKFRSGIFYSTPDGRWFVQLRRDEGRAPPAASAPMSTRSALEEGRRRRGITDSVPARLPPMMHQAPRPVHVVSVA